MIPSASSASPTWAQVQATFQQVWGYDTFRPPQDAIVRSLLEGRDTLVILPTGAGKSLCFQLPALMQRGVTVVISPLVALMENQVQELRQKQLPAACLHRELAPQVRRQVLSDLAHQRLRLLYVSPETLLSPPVWQRLQSPDVVINGLILDEAHCLVQWGDSFRPTYRRLGAVRPALLAHKPAGVGFPIAAFTATADPLARRTIRDVLQLRSPAVVALSPYRPNLDLSVETVWTPEGRRQRLARILQQRRGQSGLVYVRTRRESEAVAQGLVAKGYRAAAYHAGLTATARRQCEADWFANRVQCVVATSAFGMGVNKPDVRWVVQLQLPSLLSEYCQEVGRAGRDGQPAIAVAFVSEPTGWLDPSDRQRSQFFQQSAKTLRQQAKRLAQQIPPEGAIATVMAEFQRDGMAALAYLHSIGQLTWIDPFHYRLQPAPSGETQPPTQDVALARFCQTQDCRWRSLLQQFGFHQEARQLGRCGHCDRCRRSRPKP
ncbi:MAG: ATP-dependent DNA helicase RecQ [Leptolyngbyaceae cyanobacterium T60_A2020_046]|nr:ATP-dependent DNA helicase RecQ [Leptolyngbyaceae cyanobacterium T60_A2020_046]